MRSERTGTAKGGERKKGNFRWAKKAKKEKVAKPSKLTREEECLKKEDESLLIRAEKIHKFGRRHNVQSSK